MRSEKLATLDQIFRFSPTSDLGQKPAGMMSEKEDGQGIAVDKVPSHRRLCVFKKASCVS